MRQGSALLIAVLVMGILLTLTLGLSDLVIREIRQTTDVVSAGKAYFAAEAGVENALLDLHENLPGFETASSSDCVSGDLYQSVKDDPSNPAFDPTHPPCYRILSKADKTYNNVPSFDADKPIFLNGGDVPTNVNFVYSDHPKATYKDLPLSQTAVIPLYSATGSSDPNNQYTNVTNFLIEYYVDYSAFNNFGQISTDDLKNLDVLRWKIFGRPNATSGADQSKTDAISDFFPSVHDASASSPMCIGTDQSLSNGSCLFPVFGMISDNTSQIGGPSGSPAGLWSAARQCYLSDSSGVIGQLNDIQTSDTGGCTISDFIGSHNQNYLVLTNVINPDVLLPGQLLDSPEAKAKFTIHYRVIAAPAQNPDDPRLVREAASISSDGYAANGQVKQSIDVKINQSSFLPVFNFSLYHTDTKTQ